MTLHRRPLAPVAVLLVLAVAGGFLRWRGGADERLPVNGVATIAAAT